VASEDAAVDLRDRILGGASFHALAREHSQDPTASDGGFLGSFRRGDLRPEFQAALSGLGPGDISDVTPIGGGYFLFQILPANEQEWMTTRAGAENALRGGDTAAAGALYETAAELAGTFTTGDPRLADSLYDLAGVRFIEGRFDEAVPGYRRYMAARWTTSGLEHTDAMAGMIGDLARVLSLADFGDTEFEEAGADLRSGVRTIPLTEDAFTAIAGMLRLADLDGLSEAALVAGTEAFPESKLLGNSLGEFYSASGQSLDALEAFRQARGIDSGGESELVRLQNAFIAQRIGNVLVKLGRPDEALEAYSESLDLNPDRTLPRLALADVYITEDRLDEALAELDRVQEIDPANAGGFAGLAEVHLKTGRFDAALDAADRALALDPARDRVRYVRGQALMRLGRRDEGQEELARYQELTRDDGVGGAAVEDPREVVRRAAGLLTDGQTAAALDLLETTAAERPGETIPRLALGIAQRKSGRPGDALATFESMVEGGASSILVHWNLAEAYAEAGDVEAAGENAARVLQMVDRAFAELSN
jgi:tetratricopeptide (TPR) repeat protein